MMYRYLQALLGRAALNPLIPQLVLILGVASAHVQDLSLGLVEPREVHAGSLLELLQVPPDGILSFWHVDRTTQLGVICKLAEDALDLAVYVIDENIKTAPVPIRIPEGHHLSPFSIWTSSC